MSAAKETAPKELIAQIARLELLKRQLVELPIVPLVNYKKAMEIKQELSLRLERQGYSGR